MLGFLYSTYKDTLKCMYRNIADALFVHLYLLPKLNVCTIVTLGTSHALDKWSGKYWNRSETWFDTPNPVC